MDKKTRKPLFAEYDRRRVALRLRHGELCAEAGITPQGYRMAKNGTTKEPWRILDAVEAALDRLERGEDGT